MKRTRRPVWLLFSAVVCLAAVAPTQAAIIVYDLRIDFSNVSNPNGAWSYLKGTSPLAHYTPVPTTLSAAVAGGYWGDNASNLNGAMMLSTAAGGAAPGHSNNDFPAGHVLIRTTDPSTGAPTIVTWTAPTSGSFTYSGMVWYADAQAGPFGNSFNMTLNNGPSIESGTASIGQDYPNGVSMVNGATPVNVLAGDVLALELNPLPPAPFGTLAGVTWTIDFLPVPEPSTFALIALGAAGIVAPAIRKLRRARR